MTSGYCNRLPLKQVWSRNWITSTGTGEIKWEGSLAGVDGRYIYSWDYRQTGSSYKWKYEITIYVLDKTNGYFVSEILLEIGPARSWQTLKGMIPQEAEKKVTSIADGSLVLAEELPLESHINGLSLIIDRSGLNLYDSKNEKLLYRGHFYYAPGGSGTTIYRALVFDEMLFVSAYPKLYAFQLYAP